MTRPRSSNVVPMRRRRARKSAKPDLQDSRERAFLAHIRNLTPEGRRALIPVMEGVRDDVSAHVLRERLAIFYAAEGIADSFTVAARAIRRLTRPLNGGGAA